MTLIQTLTALREKNLGIRITEAGPVVRGRATVDDALREGLREHREHLVRLFREHENPPAWRRELTQSDDPTKEAWALLAHGHETAHALPPEAAEWIAWKRVEA